MAPPRKNPQPPPPGSRDPDELALERLDAFRNLDPSNIPEEVADTVYKLRVSGNSEENISRLTSLPPETITGIVAQRAGLRREREAHSLGIDAMLELDRLDLMLEAIWSQVQAGNLYAVDRALKIGEQRRALKGLDAPTLKATLNVSASDADIDYSQYSAEELKALTALLAKGSKKRTKDIP